MRGVFDLDGNIHPVATQEEADKLTAQFRAEKAAAKHGESMKNIDALLAITPEDVAKHPDTLGTIVAAHVHLSKLIAGALDLGAPMPAGAAPVAPPPVKLRKADPPPPPPPDAPAAEASDDMRAAPVAVKATEDWADEDKLSFLRECEAAGDQVAVNAVLAKHGVNRGQYMGWMRSYKSPNGKLRKLAEQDSDAEV